MLKFIGEINVLKYEDGMTTTSIPSRDYDSEKKEFKKDSNGEIKKIFREILVGFVGEAKDIANCFNKTKIRVDNGWLDFYIDKENHVKWKVIINKAEVLEQGEGYRQRFKDKKKEEKKEEESPFAIGNTNDLPF